MSIWLIILYIGLAGAAGGIVNALLTLSGFELPKIVKIDGVTVYKPGLLGNMFVSAVSAVVSWGLYGPLSTYVIDGNPARQQPPSLAVGAIMGALLVGAAGAKWLTSEIDKETWRATAVKATAQPGDDNKSQAVSIATPLEALNLVR